MFVVRQPGQRATTGGRRGRGGGGIGGAKRGAAGCGRFWRMRLLSLFFLRRVCGAPGWCGGQARPDTGGRRVRQERLRRFAPLTLTTPSAFRYRTRPPVTLRRKQPEQEVLMTAATATDAAAATGITDDQLVVLQAGGWDDDDGSDGTPGWVREVKAESGERTLQRMFVLLFAYGPRWNAYSGGENIWRSSLDDVLVWCDERGGGAEPAEAGSATKQEDRFARCIARVAAAG